MNYVLNLLYYAGKYFGVDVHSELYWIYGQFHHADVGGELILCVYERDAHPIFTQI